MSIYERSIIYITTKQNQTAYPIDCHNGLNEIR